MPQRYVANGIMMLCVVFQTALIPTAAIALEENKDSFARFQGDPIDSIAVDFKDFNEHESIDKWKITAKSMIRLHEGARYSYELLKESRQALKASRLFSDIEVAIDKKNGSLNVNFSLTPYRIIKDITIKGNSPVLENDIYNAMTINVGDEFIRDKLPDQEKLIRQKYLAEGFIDPAVIVTAVKSKANGNYIIRVTINPGDYYSYGDMRLHGNHGVSGIIIRYILFSSTLRFVEKEFNDNITALKKYYWRHGYPEAEIAGRLQRNAGYGTVDMDITTNEGPKYKINFQGNKKVWDYTLRKELTLSEMGNKGDAGLRKSEHKITKLYKKKGFRNVKVRLDFMKREENDNHKTATFIIEEGPRILVDSIRFSGNASFKEKILKKMMSTSTGILIKKIYDPDVLNNDILVIKSFYKKHGYLGADINPYVKFNSDRTRVTIQIDIFEGVQTRISTIEFKGNSVIGDSQLRKSIGLAEGQPFQESAAENAESQISSLISKKGYPDVAVKGNTTFSADRSRAGIVFKITEGVFGRIGVINFSGNIRTRSSYLRKQLMTKPGDPASAAQILQEYKNISDIDIFRAVSITTYGIEEKTDQADVFFHVLEKKAIHLHIGGGYKSDKGLFANAGIADKNFLGRYKSIWMQGELRATGYNGSGGITEPRLFGSNASATLSYTVDRTQEFNQTFGTFYHGPSLIFKYVWFGTLVAGLDISFHERKMFGSLSLRDLRDVDKINQLQLRRVALVTPLISYDGRDSFIRPRKGFMVSGSAQFSKNLTSPHETIFGEEYTDDFINYQLNLKFYITPFSRLTFAAQCAVGYIQAYAPVKKIMPDQQLYLGGISNVRGFKENMLEYDYFKNPIGGRASLIGSIEARIDLGLNLELLGFFDAGRVNDTFYDFYKLRCSAGTGLRYITPVGPIGFIYGMKIKKRKGEDLGELNVSIGYTF
jgi:outer membrane protein insertion porin family